MDTEHREGPAVERPGMDHLAGGRAVQGAAGLDELERLYAEAEEIASHRHIEPGLLDRTAVTLQRIDALLGQGPRAEA